MFDSKRWMACSFCGRHNADVAKLVAGPRWMLRRIYICDSCVGIAVQLMAGEDPLPVDGRQSSVNSRQSTVKDDVVKRLVSIAPMPS